MNKVKNTWFIRYPWTIETIYNQGPEFLGCVIKNLRNEHGVKPKLATSLNPQYIYIIKIINQVKWGVKCPIKNWY